MDIWNRACIPTQLRTIGPNDLLRQRLLTLTGFFSLQLFQQLLSSNKKKPRVVFFSRKYKSHFKAEHKEMCQLLILVISDLT